MDGCHGIRTLSDYFQLCLLHDCLYSLHKDLKISDLIAPSGLPTPYDLFLTWFFGLNTPLEEVRVAMEIDVQLTCCSSSVETSAVAPAQIAPIFSQKKKRRRKGLYVLNVCACVVVWWGRGCWDHAAPMISCLRRCCVLCITGDICKNIVDDTQFELQFNDRAGAIKNYILNTLTWSTSCL